jgi:AraC-like DNA-binding protein
VRQLLHLHFRLDGVPPAAKAPRPRARSHSDPSLEGMRPHTFRERRRLYLLARVVIMRYYRTSLTIEAVAKSLASSPRQLQRAFAQFGNSTFRGDLRARRMATAAELLSQPAIQVCDVARQVGYRQPSHFARAFRCLYGVSPTVFRAELRVANRREAPARPTQGRSAEEWPPADVSPFSLLPGGDQHWETLTKMPRGGQVLVACPSGRTCSG